MLARRRNKLSGDSLTVWCATQLGLFYIRECPQEMMLTMSLTTTEGSLLGFSPYILPITDIAVVGKSVNYALLKESPLSVITAGL